MIRLLALDIDGVLTDGTVEVHPAGDRGRRIHLRDLDAVAIAIRSGIMVALITGESGAHVDLLAARFGIREVVAGARDKLSALRILCSRLDVPLSEVCYVGDGWRDAPAIAASGLGLAPADASKAAKEAARIVLERCGGRGVVEEALEVIQSVASGNSDPNPAGSST